jgi:hypothetical protein
MKRPCGVLFRDIIEYGKHRPSPQMRPRRCGFHSWRREEVITVNELVFLGLVAMLAPVFAKYAGYEHEGHLDWIGVGGLFFILTAATQIPLFSINAAFTSLGHYLGILTQGFGFLFIAIGTLLGVLDVFKNVGVLGFMKKMPAHVR